jgi:hypothetical protein
LRQRLAGGRRLAEAVLRAGDNQVIFDGGTFRPGSAGHSHSDTLSIIARCGDHEILIDPGTYTYVADPQWRDWFRGSAAHNTVRVDHRNQAIPAGPFRWTAKPLVSVREWISQTGEDYLEAVCEYAGIRHLRRVLFQKPHLLIILDEVSAEGEHAIEQFWHLGEPARALLPNSFRIGEGAALALAGFETVELSQGGQHGWRSPAPGIKLPSPVIHASRRCTSPVLLAAVLSLEESAMALEIEMAGSTSLKIRGRYKLEMSITKQGRLTLVPA